MRALFCVSFLLCASSAVAYAQAAVHVQPPHLQGPRSLQEQTAAAVVKDYVESWRTLHDALAQNRPDLLDRDFAGDAREKIAGAIQEQEKVGLRATYQDASHDLQIVFYSPEGLSVQLVDNVEYDLQLQDHDKVVGSQHVRARYVAVLTPTETRWRVRVLQAVPLTEFASK